jgi:hypothetical protein
MYHFHRRALKRHSKFARQAIAVHHPNKLVHPGKLCDDLKAVRVSHHDPILEVGFNHLPIELTKHKPFGILSTKSKI